MTKRKSTRTRTRKAAPDYPLPRADGLADWQAPVKDTSADATGHMFWTAGRWLQENADRLLDGAALPFHYKSIPVAWWNKNADGLRKALTANGFTVVRYTSYINTNEHVALLVSVPEGD